MPPRSSPTARQQRLGIELRKLRERAGLSATEAAAMLGIDRAKISSIENGRFGVSATRVRTLACIYDCPDQALIDALAAMPGGRIRHWWQEYRGILPMGLLDLAELEHHARAVRITHTIHIPGLLQTADHARIIFQQVVPQLPAHEIEHRLSHRLKRQAILYQDNPPPFMAIIHEAALRMQFGGPATVRAQLRHILEMSERESVAVRVIPFSVGAFPGSGQSVCYASGPVRQLDTVQLDQWHGPVFLNAEVQLNKYRTLLNRLEAVALKPQESRDFIQKMIQQF